MLVEHPLLMIASLKNLYLTSQRKIHHPLHLTLRLLVAYYCMKSLRIRSFSDPFFSRISTEYGDLQSKFLYSIWMGKNTNQKTPYTEFFYIIHISGVIFSGKMFHQQDKIIFLFSRRKSSGEDIPQCFNNGWFLWEGRNQ